MPSEPADSLAQEARRQDAADARRPGYGWGTNRRSPTAMKVNLA